MSRIYRYSMVQEYNIKLSQSLIRYESYLFLIMYIGMWLVSIIWNEYEIWNKIVRCTSTLTSEELTQISENLHIKLNIIVLFRYYPQLLYCCVLLQYMDSVEPPNTCWAVGCHTFSVMYSARMLWRSILVATEDWGGGGGQVLTHLCMNLGRSTIWC